VKHFIRRAAWVLVPIGIALIGLGTTLAVNVVFFRPFSIHWFYEKVFFTYALSDPELLSSVRILEPFGIQGHNAKLTDASPDRARAQMDLAEKNLATLKSYDYAAQTPDQQLSTDILAWYLDDIVRGKPFLFHNYPVNQFAGEQSGLPDFMVNTHQVNSLASARHYIARLRLFPVKFGQILEGLRLRESMGIVPPKFVIVRVLAEMNGFIAPAAKDNILYTTFAAKVGALEGLAEPQRAALMTDVEAAIAGEVYTAYRNLIAFLEGQKERATLDDGVWKLPDGDAFYAHMLRSETTSAMTPEEVHRLGNAEVTRILGEMETILNQAAPGDGTVGERMAALARDPRFHYPNTDEGREQCLKDYQAIIDEISAGMDAYFDLRPRARVEVRRVPEFKEQGAAGAYYNAPALDGSRPGVFYANLRNMDEVSKFGMRTLAYHEAIPGHHFQIAIQQEISGPTFRKMPLFTAYIEGWALYTELLAWEAGFHQDPFSNLGRLQDELLRAVRLVVDTGIHWARWKREEAIAYMASTTGMPLADVTTEIERYIVLPAQACSYKVGMIEILNLRERAKNALGPRFDIKKFHNVVLRDGAMPLEVLAKTVDRYIAEEKGASTSPAPQ